MQRNSPYPILLLVILMLKAAAMVGIILYSGIGLGPDEAQYWTWSQSLDWGYYSKPPAIAWQIWLGTALFGNTELGVRFMAIVIAILLSIAVYRLARVCKLSPQTAFWAALTMSLTPLGVIASLFAITDGGFVLFWILASIPFAQALSNRSTPNYYLIGFYILCGALFKWPIYLFWGIILCFWPFYRQLFSWNFLGGIAVSLLGLLPSLYWNRTHNWVTFRHVFATVTGRHSEITHVHSHGNFIEFLGAQFALLSPIIFILLLVSFAALIIRRKQLPPALVFCGGSCLMLLILYSVLSLFQKIQGNWVDFAYPTGIVFLCWVACERLKTGKIWIQIGVALSILLCLLVLSLPAIQSHSFFSQFPIPYKINPFRHNVGWDQLGRELATAGYNPKEDFLFGDKYQMSSLLSFYGPGQKRAYFLNLQGTRKNQFSFWPSMAQEVKGKTGFFVAVENVPHLIQNQAEQIATYQKLLETYFREVIFLGVKPLFFSYHKVAKGAFLFKCIDYNGQEAGDVEKY